MRLGVPLAFFAITGAGHFLLGWPAFAPFYQLQYPAVAAASTSYGKGIRDAYLMASLFFGWMLVRYLAMQQLIRPFGRRQGIRQPGKLDRLSEQGWQFFFYAASWANGSRILWAHPGWLTAFDIVRDYPFVTVEGSVKLHCLSIAAFWLLQLFVANVEKPRKDHYVTVAHHIATLTLIGICYLYNVQPYSINISWCMDCADILLCVSRCY